MGRRVLKSLRFLAHLELHGSCRQHRSHSLPEASQSLELQSHLEAQSALRAFELRLSAAGTLCRRRFRVL